MYMYFIMKLVNKITSNEIQEWAKTLLVKNTRKKVQER